MTFHRILLSNLTHDVNENLNINFSHFLCLGRVPGGKNHDPIPVTAWKDLLISHFFTVVVKDFFGKRARFKSKKGMYVSLSKGPYFHTIFQEDSGWNFF